MATQFMAHLGPSYVETSHLSENNAIKYKLEALGSNADSTVKVPFIKLNGASRLSSYSRGITAVTISPNGVASNQATFDLYTRPEHFDTLRSYLMSAPSNNIVVLVSYDAMKSTEAFDEFMNQYGSRSWPGVPYLNKVLPDSRLYRSSYVAIFNTSLKRFCYENFVGNDYTATSDTSAYLEVVFDTVEDIGACGTPERKVDDINEYFSRPDDYAFIRYFPTENITNWEAIYHVKCELYNDQVLKDANGHARLYLWTQNSGGTWFSQMILSNVDGVVGQWNTYEGDFKLPAAGGGATLWGCQAYRWPSSAKVGLAGARNVIVTRVTRDDDDKVENAAFGVNGMRANTLSDNGNFSNPVMQLLNLKPKNVVTSNELRERT
ncbi:gp35 [Aeromonas phage 31]|uniref:Gp35 n=1 Tax=Aeromonas phage 31 TaxID=321023 RepID=Q56EE4_9CAUD|nr:long tail fiber protein proximal connector [Aeromonas phage 31]AAX63706.1 gp35 [Aeromonas phage 31]